MKRVEPLASRIVCAAGDLDLTFGGKPTFFVSTDLNGDEKPDLVMADKKLAFKVAVSTTGTGFLI